MSVTSNVQTINGFFGAVYTIDLPGEQIDFGNAKDNVDNPDTSVTVLTGEIKILGLDETYSAGQEFRRPIAELCTVEAIAPGTKIFHTLKI
jgi:hypothetical protein